MPLIVYFVINKKRLFGFIKKKNILKTLACSLLEKFKFREILTVSMIYVIQLIVLLINDVTL